MIKVDQISKVFNLYRSPVDRLKELVFRKTYHTRYQALDSISFELERGETLGILGQNGAGKSTLLKVLTGILLPDSGSVSLDGRITGLLELGTGFNTELSGRENIQLNATLLGLSPTEIQEKMDSIIDFTELGPFIEEQMKTYSSGMIMRLAFSVAIHADPTCFVVDEALSVGDAYFQQKCTKKIKEFKNAGGSIVFVSHDMAAVQMLCDRAILLTKGKVTATGKTSEVIHAYHFELTQTEDAANPVAYSEDDLSFGNFDIKIMDVRILGTESKTNKFVSGEVAQIKVSIASKIDFPELTLGIQIRDRWGQVIYGTNSFHLKTPIAVHKEHAYDLAVEIPMNLGVGKYTLTCALHSGPQHGDECFHWVDDVHEFEITSVKDNYFEGVVKLDPVLTVGDAQPLVIKY